MSIAHIKNLCFNYQKEEILKQVDLTIEKEDFLAIIGPNGGGKSTLLKLMLGILKPNSGTLSLFGEKPSKNLSKVGYVPQNTNINTDFPIQVLEVVMMGHVGHKPPLFGYAKAEIECAMGALHEVGMQDFAHSKIGALSGGQRQRVMIARALCAHPSLLLLDEPTANIDAEGQAEVYELLKLLSKSITIVVVSHDISVILAYANKVAYINKTLSYHDISNKEEVFHTHNTDGHFCEVELLKLLSSEECDDCKPPSTWSTKP